MGATVQEQIDGIEKRAAEQKRQGYLRATWKTALWFGIPFVTLWSLGVDPVVAVRVSIAPALIMGTVFIGITLMVSAMTSVTTYWLRGDAVHEELSARVVELEEQIDEYEKGLVDVGKRLGR